MGWDPPEGLGARPRVTILGRGGERVKKTLLNMYSANPLIGLHTTGTPLTESHQGKRQGSSWSTHQHRDPSISFGALEAVQSWTTL